MFSGQAPAGGRQRLYPNADKFTVLVGSGAPDHSVGDY